MSFGIQLTPVQYNNRTLSHLPKVRGRSCLANHPRFIQRLDNIIRQRPLLQIRKVTLQLLETTDANNDTVISTFDSCLELGMMNTPSQCNLKQRQVVFLSSFLCNLESLKRRVFEVAIAVHCANAVSLGPEPAFIRLDVLGLDLAGKEATRQRVVDNNVDAILATCGNQLRLNGAS